MGRKKKRYGIRVGRMAIALILLVGIVVLISMLFKSCSSSSKEQTQEEVVSTQDKKVSYSLNSFESAIERLGFEKRSYSVDDIHYGELILVNSDNEYVFNEDKLADNVEVSTEKNDFYKLLTDSITLNATTIESLNALMKDYYTQYSDGDIVVTSGYRSKAEQGLVYSQATDNDILENPAGYSDSHTGYSLDLAVLPTDSAMQSLTDYANATWLFENCAKYGFIQRYPSDKTSITGVDRPSTLRYVSLPHSMYMQENNLCLEEYITLLSNYKFGEKALRYTYDDQEYMVYFCEASSNNDTVEVYVPKDKDYTICGNNVDGFIVTVKVS